MDIMSKTEIDILHLISSEVDKIIRSNSDQSLIRNPLTNLLTRTLPQLTVGRTVKVEWDDSRTSEPYIMAMYPDPDELNKKSQRLFEILADTDNIEGNKKEKSIYTSENEYLAVWTEIKNWQLFIDSRLIDKNSSISVTYGDQFSAILAHEIGHVMNEDPISLLRKYRENLYQQSQMERLLLSKNIFVRKVALPIFVNTLQFRIIVNRPDNFIEEVRADNYIPDDFKGAMEDYVANRLLRTVAGSRLIITKEDYNSQLATGIKYHRGTLELLRKRRDILKRRLNSQYNAPGMNTYLKNLMKFCASGVVGYKPDTDENIMNEATLVKSFNRSYQSILEEYTPILEVRKITERDLVMLELDIQDIKTTDDKMWCIQTIYDYIEYVERENNKRYKKLIKDNDPILKNAPTDPRLERLWKMRSEVMNIKLDNNDFENDRYGVYIKYPKGYEG